VALRKSTIVTRSWAVGFVQGTLSDGESCLSGRRQAPRTAGFSFPPDVAPLKQPGILQKLAETALVLCRAHSRLFSISSATAGQVRTSVPSLVSGHTPGETSASTSAANSASEHFLSSVRAIMVGEAPHAAR
jgi:hypothetical protein